MRPVPANGLGLPLLGIGNDGQREPTGLISRQVSSAKDARDDGGPRARRSDHQTPQALCTAFSALRRRVVSRLRLASVTARWRAAPA